METGTKRLFLSLTVLSFACYLCHKLAVTAFFPNSKEQQFMYPLEWVYALFFIATALVLWVLIRIKKNNINNVGFSSMLITTIKSGVAAYFFLQVLHAKGNGVAIEKYSFFIVFIIFLAIETVFTISILNKKQ